MNIATAKEQIKNTVEAYLAKDEAGLHRLSFVNQRPMFLIGAPGIGKTAIMEQVAQELGIGIVSYSMTHHTRQSALGLPRIVQREFEGFEYSASEYTMSEIVASIYDYMKQTGLRSGILFLDEINCVSETLYPSMLQFLQFKTFGRHRIPDDWVIVCAGNPPEYNKSVHTFDVVTLDRLREIRVEPDYESWRRYAQEKGLHPAVTTFLEAKQDCFYTVSSKPGGEKSFVTARGWEDLAEVIELYEEMDKVVDRDLIGQFLHDDDIADRFAVYYGLFAKYRSDYQVWNILDGTFDEQIVKRAQNAEFDERIALIGLIMDALGSSCEKVLEKEDVAVRVRDMLRDAKENIVGGAFATNVLALPLGEIEMAIARHSESRIMGDSEVRRDVVAVEMIKRFLAKCDLSGATSGPDSYRMLGELYKEEISKIDPAAEDAGKKMDNAFAFIEQVYGNGREMLVFMTEVATRQSTTQFVARHGNDSFYAHNDELQVDDTRRKISAKIAQLGLSEVVNTGLDAGAAEAEPSPSDSEDESKPSEFDNYYGGGRFEYGFESTCSMNLPDDLEGKTVLDIACRRGKGVYKISSLVGDSGRAIGLDWDEEYIEAAKAGAEDAWHKSGLQSDNMQFVVGYPEDLASVGIEDASVDVVYINSVFTLLADPARAIAEMHRVLKPGGMLVLDTAVASGPRYNRVVAAARAMGNSVQSALPMERIEKMLTKAGFTGMEVVGESELDPEKGYEEGYKVPMVNSNEDITFKLAEIHATARGEKQED